MDDPNHPEIDWRAVAAALSDGIGVQVDERFVDVSAEMAALVGRDGDRIEGRRWRHLFNTAEATRIETEALGRARGSGQWTGTVRVSDGGAASTDLELTLSAMGDGVVVWNFSEFEADKRKDGRSSDRESETRTAVERPELEADLAAAVDGIAYVVSEERGFVDWNQELCDRFGYGDGEIADLDPRSFFRPRETAGLSPDSASVIDTLDRHDVLDLVTRDGESVPYELSGVTYVDEETGRRYRVGVGREITTRLERERRLDRYETIVETVRDGIYVLGSDLRFEFVNERFCEMFGLSDEEAVGMHARQFYDEQSELDEASDLRERLIAAGERSGTIRGTFSTPRGERIVESNYRLYPEPDAEFRGSVGVVRDITERETRKRQLERQRDELATLDRINRLLLETARELTQTTSREAVEQTICERLASAGRYRFAWIGERAFDSDRIVLRVAAGDDDGYISEITAPADETRLGQRPAGRAIATGEVQAVNVDDPSFEPWQEDARKRGIESVAAIPIQHDETIYGVLLVYATRADAFNPREQAGFETLGRTVGLVIHTARNRELLFADSIVELEFDLSGTRALIPRTARELDCEFSLDGYVATDNQWLLYLSVTGISPATVVEAITDDPRIERGGVVKENEDAGKIELLTGSDALLSTVTRSGATMTNFTAEPEAAKLVVEAPGDADVSAIVDHICRNYPEVTFRARRERDREISTISRPGSLLDALTDRQREALEIAYRAGYFAWPRGSTAEEVAEVLDLAPSTLHAHLRKAEQTLLSAIFDGDGGTPVGPER